MEQVKDNDLGGIVFDLERIRGLRVSRFRRFLRGLLVGLAFRCDPVFFGNMGIADDMTRKIIGFKKDAEIAASPVLSEYYRAMLANDTEAVRELSRWRWLYFSWGVDKMTLWELIASERACREAERQ